MHELFAVLSVLWVLGYFFTLHDTKLIIAILFFMLSLAYA